MPNNKQSQSAVIYILTAFFLFVAYCAVTTKKVQENGLITLPTDKWIDSVEWDKY